MRGLLGTAILSGDYSPVQGSQSLRSLISHLIAAHRAFNEEGALMGYRYNPLEFLDVLWNGGYSHLRNPEP